MTEYPFCPPLDEDPEEAEIDNNPEMGVQAAFIELSIQSYGPDDFIPVIEVPDPTPVMYMPLGCEKCSIANSHYWNLDAQ